MAIEYKKLISYAGSTAFMEGTDSYQKGYVHVSDYGEDFIYAEVRGSRGSDHLVDVNFYNSAWDDIEGYYCDCPVHESSRGMCEHVVATLLEANDINLRQEKSFGTEEERDKSDQLTLNLITNYAQEIFDNSVKPVALEKDPLTLECTLHFEEGSPYYRSDETFFLTLKVGSKKPYVVKNMSDFMHCLQYSETLEMTKKYSITVDFDSFDPQEHSLLTFLLDNYNPYIGSPYRTRNAKVFHLNRKSLDMFLSLMAEQKTKFNFERGSGKGRTLTVMPKNPRLKLSLEKSAKGYELSSESMEHYMRGWAHCYVLKQSTLYQCDIDYTKACSPLLNTLANYGGTHVAAKDVPAIFASVIPTVRPYMEIDIHESAEIYVPDPLEVKIYLDLNENEEVLARMTFTYGASTFDAFGGKDSTESLDLVGEVRAEEMVARYMGYILQAPGTLIQDDEEMIYLLLSEGVQDFHSFAEVYVSDALKNLKIERKANVSVGVRIEANLLQVDIDLDGIDYEELSSIIASYRLKKRYHRLRDGSFLPLEDGALGQIADLSETLALSESDLAEGHFSLPKNKALYLDAQLKMSEHLRYSRDSSIKDMVRQIQSIEDSDFIVPKNLEQVLRGYQAVGYQWLRVVHQLEFAGILADDMGLGKTLQVLTLLQSLKNEKAAGVSVVICPASLVYNWKKEAETFTPGLEVCAIAGTAEERRALLETAQNYDLLVTSYDLVKRDIEYYENVSFTYVILDEAHYIKNQNTQSAKSVKLLQAEHRLALTGTPIENNLAELWSVFDFLMPGYLYGYTRFKRDFETPITKKKDEAAVERLRLLVRPFILRRLKGDVLTELPAKIEQTHTTQMSDEQRKIYVATLARSKKELHQKLKELQPGQSRIHILAALTRLR